MKIVIPDPIWGVPEKYLDELRTLGADLYDERPKDEAEAKLRLRDAEIVTFNYLGGSKEIIDAAPKLKYIVSPAVGFNHINWKYAASKGITVSNCPTFVPLAVAEHAFALLLSLTKKLPQARIDMQSGAWTPNTYVGFELAGKTLGLVGYGNIGKHLERIAKGFSMDVIYVNSASTPDEVDDLLHSSDVVCLCLPLNGQTHYMIDKRRLKSLKKTAYLINVARGAVVDQSALLESLKNKDFAGAGLDVFEDEPMDGGKVTGQILELVRLPNVVATPHSAFNTPEALDRLGQEIVSNIRAFMDGKPKNIVN